MRILHLPGYRYPASLQEPIICGDLRHTFNLSRAFQRAGADVTVLSRGVPADPTTQTLDGVHIRRYRSELRKLFPTSFDISFARSRQFIDLASESDLIIANTPLSLELAVKMETPLIYICSGLQDVRNYSLSLKESIARLAIRLVRDPLKRKTWRVASVINTTAEAEKALLASLGAPHERIAAVGPGVERERYYPRSPVEVSKARRSLGIDAADQRSIVLSLGRFTPAKGAIETLQAFRELSSTRKDVLLALVGVPLSHDPHYLRRVRAEVARRDLVDRVLIRTNYPESELPSLLSAADVVSVFSVGYDPLPTVIPESLSCGTPVVSTYFEPRTQLLAHGVEGLFVREGDTASWGLAMERLLSDRREREKMARAGISRAVGQFDMNMVALDYLRLAA